MSEKKAKDARRQQSQSLTPGTRKRVVKINITEITNSDGTMSFRVDNVEGFPPHLTSSMNLMLLATMKVQGFFDHAVSEGRLKPDGGVEMPRIIRPNMPSPVGGIQ